jgi:hypothetical protein
MLIGAIDSLVEVTPDECEAANGGMKRSRGCSGSGGRRDRPSRRCLGFKDCASALHVNSLRFARDDQDACRIRIHRHAGSYTVYYVWLLRLVDDSLRRATAVIARACNQKINKHRGTGSDFNPWIRTSG